MTETSAHPLVSARSVADAIDARRPGLKPGKVCSLMFFVQGHHAAHFGVPLFREPLVVTDRGVVVRPARMNAPDLLDEGDLNTIGYVVERYGSLSPADLRTLIMASRPWLIPEIGDEIDIRDLADWFRRDDETNDPDDERPNRAERAQVAAMFESGR